MAECRRPRQLPADRPVRLDADVAGMLGAKVLIVSEGGIGKPVDEIMLSAALFEKKRVDIAGVIINKVKAAKFAKINELVRESLQPCHRPVGFQKASCISLNKPDWICGSWYWTWYAAWYFRGLISSF